MGKRNPAQFRDKPTFNESLQRSRNSSTLPIRAGYIVNVTFGEEGEKFTAMGYCKSYGNGRTRLIGYVGKSSVWQFNGAVDDILLIGEIYDLGNRVKVYPEGHQVEPILKRELRHTPIRSRL